jgi:hypothetical protein
VTKAGVRASPSHAKKSPLYLFEFASEKGVFRSAQNAADDGWRYLITDTLILPIMRHNHALALEKRTDVRSRPVQLYDQPDRKMPTQIGALAIIWKARCSWQEHTQCACACETSLHGSSDTRIWVDFY